MQIFEKYLNPLHTRLDILANFSNVKYTTPLENEEYPHLEQVTNINIEVSKKMISNLHKLEFELEEQAKRIQMETDLDERKAAVGVYNKILNEIQICIERINRELIKVDAPYFGKIVFKTIINRSERVLPIYIGKFALMDPKTYQPLISDWRALLQTYTMKIVVLQDLQYDTLQD